MWQSTGVGQRKKAREFRDMLVEFDGVDDDTEEDWVGWLLFKEEFRGLLYFYVEEEDD